MLIPTPVCVQSLRTRFFLSIRVHCVQMQQRVYNIVILTITYSIFIQIDKHYSIYESEEDYHTVRCY